MAKRKVKENNSIINVDICDEMKQSYLDYSMSVIVSRALPDLKDGLKPVHRRIIYACRAVDKYTKCARTVGEVLSAYHPHGDVSVYNTLVRLSQPFKMYIPLIDGHGNFGSLQGDSAAAYRYTEHKYGIHNNTLYFGDRLDGVTWKNNYDDSKKEPTFLPAIFPIILVNAVSGMAVGMATDIPSHNILEVLDTYIAYIQKKLNNNNIRKFLLGPDTCIPASIIDAGGIDRAYITGKGSYSVAASFIVEEASYGRHNLVFTSIPPDKTTSGIVEKIANLVKAGKLEGISDLADESSMEGIRIVVTTKKGVNPKDLVTLLFSMNILYDRYKMSLLMLDNGVPKVMGIMDIMQSFHKHNLEMHTKIFTTKIDKFHHRLKLLDGLNTVITKYEEAIKIITSAKSKTDAMDKIKKKYKLDDDQADYILSSKLYSFVSKGDAIAEEVNGIKGELKTLEANLKDIDGYLIGELKKLKVTFKSFKRRSNITVLNK